MASKPLLQIIEDDVSLAELLSNSLSNDYICMICPTGRKGLETFSLYSPSIVILDLSLPDQSGLQVCQIIRKNSLCPIMVMTGEDDIVSKMSLFRAGADDYMVKPFVLDELRVRLNALLRRYADTSNQGFTSKTVAFVINLRSRKLQIDNRAIYLRQKEVELLIYLVRRQGITVTREMIISQIWPNDYPRKNIVDAHIKNLRKSIISLHDIFSIVSVYGIGYRLEGICVLKLQIT